MSRVKTCHARGFTLTECCMAVALAAVLVAVAVPSFRDALERRELMGRAGELAADLQLLRTEAVARQQAMSLSLTDTPAGACYVLHTGAAGACTCTADAAASCEVGALALKSVLLPAAGPVKLTAKRPSTAFHPVRGNAAPMNTFVLSDAHGRAVEHVVSTLGRVRSCTTAPGRGSYAPC